MKYFLLILVFFISSCSSPEPGTDEWFKEKHKELLKADPEVNLSLEEFKDIFSSYLPEEVSDESLMEKHSIRFWLMGEDLLPSSEDSRSIAPIYIRILKQCAANFSVMYSNMEAGLMYGEAITGLDDMDEMSRLSNEYKDHAYYFATRASEIHFKLRTDDNPRTSGVFASKIKIFSSLGLLGLQSSAYTINLILGSTFSAKLSIIRCPYFSNPG